MADRSTLDPAHLAPGDPAAAGRLADPHSRAEAATTTVVIPAYNEGPAVGAVVRALRAAAPWREILVIDDGSTDGTAEHARGAGARVVRHPYNKGNGAAVKTGIRQAATDWVLVIDADGQHRPEDALRLLHHLGDYDLVVGARSRESQATALRRVGNEVLNALAGYLAGRRIPDLTSGFRAARRRCLLEFLHMLPNGFSTPTTTTLAFLRAGYNVHFEPVTAEARSGASKIRLSSDGPKFFLILLRVITIFSPLKIFVPLSAATFVLGLTYGLGNYYLYARIPNGAVILLMFSVMVFLVGLVSEQIAMLRFQGTSREP
jgi:glycosyltransferase involved in cell wall biosynthesis